MENQELDQSTSADEPTGEEEDEETIAPMCTCGHFHRQQQQQQQQQHDNVLSKPKNDSVHPRKTSTWLESSFVHLVAPRRQQRAYARSKNKYGGMSSTASLLPYPSKHGFLAEHHHMKQLLEAASSTSPDVCLCSNCIDRVAAALEADTQRLYSEVYAYQQAATEAKQRAKTLEAISRVDLYETEGAYLNEIAMLEQEVMAREAELEHLNELYKEQITIAKELDDFSDCVQEQQNALELQSKSFDDSVKLLSKTLSTVQIEVDQLSIVRLPLALFHLQVDERGLRYPLINQLRLAFRPKGDASDGEIRAAWSQATQLLLILGTLLQYPSTEWKVVPISDCAKLIYRKEIFALRPGDCRSLMAWNALLDQVIRHAKTLLMTQEQPKSQQQQQLPPRPSGIKPPPFPSSPSSIGNTELARLDRTDQVGWSQVIHRMASNLLWLSESVSELVALQVSTLAHSVH